MAVRIASRSVSLAAQSHISSSDFGGVRTAEAPMARAGASAHAATSAMPRTASIPMVSPRCSKSRSGSEYRRIGGWPSSLMLADEPRGRRPPADEVILLQAQDPQTTAGHDRGGGQAVVTRTDHNGVVVTHR